MDGFKRELRYEVIKLSHLSGDQKNALNNFMLENNILGVSCVVVEEDWPEYEKVWHMIKSRMGQNP